jgi:hypothetical protein
MKKKISLLSVFSHLVPANGMKDKVGLILSLSFLFTISFIYYLFLGDGIFFSQENNSLFIFSADYFEKFSDKPGGLLVYVANFLTQFYYSSLAGSFIISFLLILIFLILHQIARFLHASESFCLLFTLLPSVILMLLQTRYDLHLQQILGFLIVLCWFFITIWMEKTFFRIISVILVPLLYYFAGSFTIVYLGLYIAYCLFYLKGRSRYLVPLSLMVSAAVTFIVYKEVIFLQPVSRLVAYPLFLNETSRTTHFLTLFSCLLILLPYIIKTTGSVVVNTKISRSVTLITLLTIFPLSIWLLIRNYDPVIANVLRSERMVYAHDWDGVIRMNEKLQSTNILEQYYYNLALSEKGELCSRMFFARQSYGSLSLTLIRNDEQSHRAMYFYYAIGLTSEAHHLAFEQMVQHGYRPENIKMLIKTELINGNYKIAERYINVLKATIHYKKWAAKYEKMLFNPAIVKSDAELGAKLRLMPKKDFFILTDDFRNLETLVSENPDNRIAFEYKMAKLLLEKDLMELGSEINKFRGLGYDHFPRHIEEAIVSLVNITKEFPDMGGASISHDTDQRFIEYFAELKPFKGNRKLIEKEIKKTEKNTFWYYLQYGLGKSDFLKSAPGDNSIY